MKFSLPFSLRAWLLAPACACGFLIAINAVRLRHLNFVTNAAGTPPALDAASPTGYAGGVREFVPGGSDFGSCEWIAQVQQMFSHGEWRVRHVDYDYPPDGRDIVSASPYRWWLAGLAGLDHLLTGRPLGVAVEQAALFSDPLLLLLVLAGTTIFVARRFGTFPAALASIGLAATFPFAAGFLPGQPHAEGLQLAAALWSILPLLVVRLQPTAESLRRHFIVAGVVGGCGLWLSVGTELPVLIGIVAGALLAARLTPRGGDAPPPPWRAWAIAGALTCLAARIIEFLPAHDPGWRLDVVHPLHGLAWLGAGELLVRADARLRGAARVRSRRGYVLAALAAIAVIAPIVMAIRARQQLFSPNPEATRLTVLFDGTSAGNLFAWLAHEGVSHFSVATLLPLLLVVPAIWLLWRRGADAPRRVATAIALGPVAAALAVACFHLRAWAAVDATVLVLLVALTSGRLAVTARWLWGGAVGLALLPAVILLSPAGRARDSVSEPELESLIDRDLAHWLARRTGENRAAVLASPDVAAALAFEGGFKALGTPSPENSQGLNVAMRIAGTTSQDEAYALIQRHQITHVVLASWDPALEKLASLGGDQSGKSLVALLHRWLPPRWLRPVPYRLPEVAGFEGQAAVVFETVELQDNSLALARLAEYFAETGQPDLAGRAAFAIGRLHPDDLGAQVARVQAARAAGDHDEARDGLKAVETRLDAGAAATLPWERRVDLAIVLAEAKRFDQARAQLGQCLAEIDESRLRSLTPLELFRFVALTRALGLQITDARLAALALALLPPEMRANF
ncbi:MAG TPA: hypothetical protein VG710_02180 [Opitutus sp.]|nr:hypothetical protein [Opitutus sp.]